MSQADIRRRIRGLEADVQADRPCEGCGYLDGLPVKFDVAWVDGPDPEGGDAPEYCPACGRQLVCTVTLTDEGEGGTVAH